jgi:hypothetical protein
VCLANVMYPYALLMFPRNAGRKAQASGPGTPAGGGPASAAPASRRGSLATGASFDLALLNFASATSAELRNRRAESLLPCGLTNDELNELLERIDESTLTPLVGVNKRSSSTGVQPGSGSGGTACREASSAGRAPAGGGGSDGSER